MQPPSLTMTSLTIKVAVAVCLLTTSLLVSIKLWATLAPLLIIQQPPLLTDLSLKAKAKKTWTSLNVSFLHMSHIFLVAAQRAALD